MMIDGASRNACGERSMQMDNLTFGMTVLVVGMGGTIVTLWVMSLIMRLLTRIFPYREGEDGK
jgi:hypothetical protein